MAKAIPNNHSNAGISSLVRCSPIKINFENTLRRSLPPILREPVRHLNDLNARPCLRKTNGDLWDDLAINSKQGRLPHNGGEHD